MSGSFCSIRVHALRSGGLHSSSYSSRCFSVFSNFACNVVIRPDATNRLNEVLAEYDLRPEE